MYIPPAFREDDPAALRALMRGAGLANLVTATADGPIATPLPLVLAPEEGEQGVLYGHVAKANLQWKTPVIGEALAIFMGPDAYVTPSWYAAKAEHGKVVPTWNYVSAHVYGPIEFFEDETLGGGQACHRIARRTAHRAVAGERRARGLYQSAAARHCRPAPADHPARGQAQDEPEPQCRRSRRRRQRAR